TTPLVLKVARDEDRGRRLHDEAERLRNLRHHLIAHLVDGPLSVGGRTSLLLDFAGAPTLAEELQANGRLSLELLERYGRDLLDIVAYLDGQGVIHRDIKPANLAARPRPKDRQKHLCIFDFSLANTPADQITAGTPPYLDPFLGLPHRPRFDLAAERFAAAVTLYETATGLLPRWGDGIAHPAAIPDEVTITQELFDPAVANPLGEFFARALARDACDRFDTIEEMADAWRSVFKNVKAGASEKIAATSTELITRDTPLDLAGLTARARSALERLGVRTVGDLVDYSATALSQQDDIPQATKKEIRRRARELRTLLASTRGPEVAAEPAAGQPRARSVDSLVALLVPRATTKNRTEVTALRMMLGLEPAGEDSPTFLHWPAQVDVVPYVDMTQPQLSRMMAKRARRWATNEDLAEVRDEIVELLDAAGGVMSAVELAQALIASRGTLAIEPRRTAQAVGLVHAAVAAELSRGGDARVGTRKSRGGVLIGREPDDPTTIHTSEDLLRYAVQLGLVAEELTVADSLPAPARAIDRLRRVTRPAAMLELSDSRLVQLAAAAGFRTEVNSQLQLYPEGMAAERALRLAAGSLVLPRGQTLPVDKLRRRVESRFPRAAPLPERPALDRLLAACGIALEWDRNQQVYRPPVASSGSLFATPTGMGTVGGQAHGTDTISEAQTRIVAALDRNAFLALLVTPSDVTLA
ncbi:MAG TPA: BREX system serine/threonine kinase PglW, partial [Micromonosporaceae bacterium]|nr:BREX system serine/threonine kinase PglW [Micromonosporaceae bacterium]